TGWWSWLGFQAANSPCTVYPRRRAGHISKGVRPPKGLHPSSRTWCCSSPTAGTNVEPTQALRATVTDLFQPAWWLPGPHLQTLWNPFFRTTPTLARRRERLWLADGDFIDLDWHGPHDATAPLVLVLHGLTGS